MKIDEQKVFDYLLTCPEGTKIYLGADSERSRDKKGVWSATYYLVCVVHIGGNKGCKIFWEKSVEPDYDKKQNRPIMRMMTEAHKIAGLYNELRDAIEASKFAVSIHLDINPDERHGSSCAVEQAVGYIKGMCNIDPELKPNAFAASYAADRGGNF